LPGRFQIQVSLEIQDMFHIAGSGRNLPLVDLTVEMDERGKPYIPGSSVKGRVRAYAERLMRTAGLQVCSPPVPEHMCPHANVDNEDEYCPACLIFGSPWVSSRVNFSNFYLADGNDFILQTRQGIGVGRTLGTVVEEKLYFWEAVGTATKGKPLSFNGEISGTGERSDIGWILAAFRMMSSIGGQKARGMGRVMAKIGRVRFWNEKSRKWHSYEDPENFCKEAIALALASGNNG